MRAQLKSIILTTDFSDLSNQAVPYGIALAEELGAKLYLCHVIDLPSVAVYDEIISDPVEQQNRMMNYAHEHISLLMAGQSVDWEPLVTIGHTADEIARMAEERDVDLAISASRGRSGLKRLIMGSVTERLMRTLPCPLLIVPSPRMDPEAFGKKENKFQRILVGCDFSSDSSLAFQYGLSLAQEFQSELHMAHVVEPPVYKDLLKPSPERGHGLQKKLREQLSEKLIDLFPEEARNWCNPKTSLLAGQPHEELIKYAVVNDVDLIVLGLRGHGLVETAFVGSTTDRVARRAPCPVLSVRPMAKGD